MVSNLDFTTLASNLTWILPLGGCREFGMNATAYLTESTSILVDCGVLFPEPRMLGTNAIYPDFSGVFGENRSLDAYVITHGHEDHIGAIPFAYRRWPAPIYATPWTAELIRRKFEKIYPVTKLPLFEVPLGGNITVGEFRIEYFPVHHSIPDTCSLLIKSPGGSIFHTGDFKFEDEPIDGKPIQFDKLRAYGKEGIDLLLADSTNSLSPGKGPSELVTEDAIAQVISNAPGRTFITTFSSNFWRLQCIVQACTRLGKRLFIAGRGMETTLDIAKDLGRFTMPPGILASEQDLKTIEAKSLVILVSGSQGEYRAALPTIVNGDHRLFSIEKTDTLIFSSRMIPGNERAILRVKSEFEKFGGTVVTVRDVPDIHVSGHAHRDDLLTLIDLIKPRTLIPIHGTFSQLIGHRNLGRDRNVPEVDSLKIMENGCLIELKGGHCQLLGEVEIDHVFIESDSSVEITKDVLRQRLKIGELGLGLVSGAYRLQDGTWVSGPKIELVGLSIPGDQSQWLQRMERQLRESLGSGRCGTLDEVVEACRIFVRKHLQQVFGRKPVVIVTVHGV